MKKGRIINETFANTGGIAKTFSNLNDPMDQRARFEKHNKACEGDDDEEHMMDEDFLNALKCGSCQLVALESA